MYLVISTGAEVMTSSQARSPTLIHKRAHDHPGGYLQTMQCDPLTGRQNVSTCSGSRTTPEILRMGHRAMRPSSHRLGGCGHLVLKSVPHGQPRGGGFLVHRMRQRRNQRLAFRRFQKASRCFQNAVHLHLLMSTDEIQKIGRRHLHLRRYRCRWRNSTQCSKCCYASG